MTQFTSWESPAWTGSPARETLISHLHLFLPHDLPPSKKSSTINKRQYNRQKTVQQKKDSTIDKRQYNRQKTVQSVFCLLYCLLSIVLSFVYCTVCCLLYCLLSFVLSFVYCNKRQYNRQKTVQ
jgi:uncharacterized membrane protein YagU involved in acid resistance